MKTVKKYALLFALTCSTSSSMFSAHAQTSSDSAVLACGKAQMAANECLKEEQNATTGIFSSLAAKVTKNDMGKTAANKGASQAANLICKDKLEKADTACGAPVSK